MLVRHKMQRCVTVHPETSVAAAQRLLRSRGAAFLVVQDRQQLYGVIVESDLSRALPSGSWALRASPARRAEFIESVSVGPLCRMTGETATTQTTVAEAVALMRRHQLCALPVVAGGQVIGVVGMFGFVDTILSQLSPPSVSAAAHFSAVA